jgi:hypothetical protein
MAPTVSPDGTRFAFVQFVAGIPTLYTADLAGGRASSWTKVTMTSRRGLTHDALFLRLEAEDINVTHALIHMDGTRIMGRWEDLTGTPSPLSTPTHILEDTSTPSGRASSGPAGVPTRSATRFTPPSIGHAPFIRSFRRRPPEGSGRFSL